MKLTGFKLHANVFIDDSYLRRKLMIFIIIIISNIVI